jgi:SAM-dependent methyltransferase
MDDKNITRCSLCGGNADLMENKLPGYQEPETFKIYQCLFCNTSFALPRVETKAIYESIYKNGNVVPGYSRYWQYMVAVKSSKKPLEYLSKSEDIYWSVKEALYRLVKEKSSTKILEVGSGLGYLTYSLNIDGYKATGLDISQTAVTQANNFFGNYYICDDLFKYAVVHSSEYDLVIFTEVIEHIDEPLPFIESILKMIKPGGHAIITTPNKSIFPKDIVWKTENPPIHWWWFSEESIKFIAEKYNVKLDLIDFSPFYKKNYTSIDLAKYRVKPPQKATLSSSGAVLAYNDRQNYLLKLLRSFLSTLPWIKAVLASVKNYLQKVKEASNPDIVICNERGNVLCAILEKKFL